jgi:hypothetical protein
MLNKSEKSRSPSHPTYSPDLGPIDSAEPDLSTISFTSIVNIQTAFHDTVGFCNGFRRVELVNISYSSSSLPLN